MRLILLPIILAAAALAGAAAPPNAATPGYEAALARAEGYKDDAKGEAFRKDVLMPAVLSKLSDVLDKCQPGGEAPTFTMIYSYRGGRFDGLELSQTSPLALCMAEGFKRTVAWPAAPIPDYAARSDFVFKQGPPPDDTPGDPTPGYEAAMKQALRYNADPKGAAFRTGVLTAPITKRLQEVTLPACVPKGLVAKFTLVYLYKDGRIDRIESSKDVAVARCVISDLMTRFDWPKPPIADYAGYLEFELNPPRTSDGK